MRRETHGPRETYRDPSRPSEPRFTVITVRPDEYSEPDWIQALAEFVRRWRARRPAR